MQHIFTFLKGMAMGAADVVPGVSGGTVAFISGIYERLLNALKSIHPRVLTTLFKSGIKAAWQQIDGTFLLALMLGILTSVLSLAKVITIGLEKYPQLIWSFFFGLVLSSTWFIARDIVREGKKALAAGNSNAVQSGGFNLISIVAFIIGAGIAYTITILSPTTIEPSYPMVFLAGAIAICAMILPGISGSFILLLMGMYAPVLAAAKDLNIVFIGIFMMGCLLGLLAFSHVLSWLFRNYRSAAMAMLAGFMLGSLNKVWPWQNVVATRTNSKGETVPWLYQNVLPANYTGHEPMLLACIGLLILGFVAVFALEMLNTKKE
jgi:putative membrane protein